MKLRLENSDNSIVLDSNGGATIAANIPVQMLLGAIVNNKGVLSVVTQVSVSNGVATLVIEGGSLAYTLATGEVEYTAKS